MVGLATWLGRILRIALIIPALLVLPGLLEASRAALSTADDALAERHYARVRAHLEVNGPYGDLAVLPVPGWKIVAISHMASGLMSMAVDARQSGDTARLEEIGELLVVLAQQALLVEHSPYDRPLQEVSDFNDWGFYLGHVSLTLGCYRYVIGAVDHDLLHRRIVRYQLARMAADGDQHARSYPNSYKWPADQALTLAGIHLYDRIHGTRLSVDPIADWLAVVHERSVEGMHPLTLSDRSALPVLAGGQLLPPMDSGDVPRGSALSPTTFYMAQFAPDAAAELYARYRASRWAHPLGMGGLREWPQGERGWDLEGGPVLLGLGSIASVQGLAPARLFGDEVAYGSLMRAVTALGIPEGWRAGRGYLLAPLLVETWILNGVVARTWFEPLPALSERKHRPPAPLGAWVLLLGDLVFVLALAAPMTRWLRRREGAGSTSEVLKTAEE